MPKKEFFYEHILNDMIRRIENGEYRYKQLLPPERNIAEEYQANRTTVRKALMLLEQKGYIEKRQGASSQVIYEKKDTEHEYGAEEEEKIIGFFVPGSKSKDIRFDQPFYMSMYFYIELECRKYNYRVVCITLVDLDDFISITKKYTFSGAFFMSKMHGDIVEYARNMGIPAVSVNSRFPDTPCITMDNVHGGYLAARYLLEKGHRKIAFITGPDSYFTSEDRMLGAMKAMNERQMTIPESRVLQADWTYDGGLAAMRELLDQKEEEWPTAIFSFNEEMTHGVMEALKEKGLSVPKDMSVIGFENTSITKYRNVITMIDSDMKQMAKTVATLLLNLMDGRGLQYELTVLVPVRLLEAGTVADVNGGK